MAELSNNKAFHKVFEDYAKEYDSWYFKHPAIYESEVRVLKEFNLKGLGLEIGVGTGVFASRIGVDLGIDPALAMLQIAKERGVEVIQAIGEHLPFVDKIFDYVLMVCTLCFLDKPSLVIKESFRVLKKGESLIVCLILKDSAWGRFYEEKKGAGHKFYSCAKFYTPHELKKLIADQGLSIVEAMSTLSYSPFEEERVEGPLRGYKGSFVCLRVKE
ncbi:MAG: class I SAM-dependent methyltransferase [Nitrososphaerales archaeon]